MVDPAVWPGLGEEALCDEVAFGGVLLHEREIPSEDANPPGEARRGDPFLLSWRVPSKVEVKRNSRAVLALGLFLPLRVVDPYWLIVRPAPLASCCCTARTTLGMAASAGAGTATMTAER